jgi:hypothetical protein
MALCSQRLTAYNSATSWVLHAPVLYQVIKVSEASCVNMGKVSELS